MNEPTRIGRWFIPYEGGGALKGSCDSGPVSDGIEFGLAER